MSGIDGLLERVAVRRSLPEPERRRDVRVRLGVSLRELADAVGVVDVATISRWERGLNEPRGANLDRYVAVLRVLAEECDQEPDPEKKR